MADPYTVLGVDAAADDAAIRARYLELTRQFPPELHPEKAAAVRTAYEALKTFDARVRLRLFDIGAKESIDAILEEVACRTPRPRIGLDALVTATKPAAR